MKRLYTLALLFFFAAGARGQLFMINYFTGTTFFGTYGVTVTSSGAACSGGGDPCFAPTADQYWIACGSSPGSYTYTFSRPVYRVGVHLWGINGGPLGAGEFMRTFINGSPYMLTTADITSPTECLPSPGAGPCYISGGTFMGPVGTVSDYNGGDFVITYCSGINSFTCFDTGTIGGIALYGIAYAVFIDTNASGCSSASNNGPLCAGDTLKLFGTGDTTQPFHWYGPGGFTSTLRNPIRTGVTLADTGIYFFIQTVGGVSDTQRTDVVIKPLPVVTATTNAPICSGSPGTLLLFASPDSTGETFTWSGPDGFTSTLQNPSIGSPATSYTGTYKVVTTWNGCTDSGYVTVTIDSTPVAPVAGNNTPICSGIRDTLLLTATDATAGVSYSWAGPNSFTSALQDPSIPDVPVSASGTYTVTAYINYDGLICSSKNTTTAVIDSTPYLPTVGSNAPICSGNTLLLSANSTNLIPTFTTNYTWSGPNGFISFLQNPSISPATTSATGTYTVFATIVYPGIPGGCISDTASLAVVVDSTPVAPVASSNSPGPPSVCQGDTLILTSSDATAGVTYFWSGPAGFTSTMQNPNPIAPVMPAATGLYTVTATLGSCSSFTVITVSITPTPIVTATNNGPVCTGINDTLFLEATGNPGTTYLWTGPYTFSSSLQTPFRTNVTMEHAGVYHVTAFLNGCASLPVNDTVVIRQTPPVPWLKSISYCQHYIASPLQAFGDSILWYASSAHGSPGTPVAPVPPTNSDTVMWFYATQTLMGCTSAVDSMQVTVNPKPVVTVTPSVSLCPHDTAVLTATDNDPEMRYHWAPYQYIGDTSTASVTVRPETDVTYTVVTTNQYNCKDTANVTVFVRPGAVISINTTDSAILYPGETYQLNPQTNCTWLTWFPPAGLSNANITNPLAAPDISTQYIVTGATEYGCTTKDSINIYVRTQSLLALPNAFSPGSGPNNLFKILKRGEATLNYFRIFDRWGVKVFETTNIDAGWDGTFNGTPQPFGVYVYEVSAVTSAGQNFIMLGNTTLIR